MALETVVSFFTASLLLALAPGPDNIFVLTHSVMRGREAGLAVVMGLCTGLLVHTTLVALGIAVIFQSSSWAFMTLKVAGAIYLLYLAWQVLAAEPLSLADNAAHRPDIAWSYRRGIIMNITNPKVSLFFLAFLPQFVTPEANAVALQIFALGGLFILATIFVFGTIAIMAAVISASLISSARWQKNLNRLAALVFVLLATHLIFTA